MDTKETNPKDAFGIRKPGMSAVPVGVLQELGVAMQEGAAKYGRHNFRVIGVRASVYYDAAFRHLMSWWEGEDIDPDSQLSHVTKAIASLVVIRDAMIQEKFVDDRPPKGNYILDTLKAKVDELWDKIPNPVAPYTETKVYGR